MNAKFEPCTLKGKIAAPSSKSMAHRYLIGAALSKEQCILSGDFDSEDILASIDCLKALGAEVNINNNGVTAAQANFMKVKNPILKCRESGSTLRFFIPLALCLNGEATLKGSTRLFERPLSVYEDLCRDNGFKFQKNKNCVKVCGSLKEGSYTIRGDISSQFITGLIFAFVYLNKDSVINIVPPFESRPYVNLTISALKSFGANVEFVNEYTIAIKKSHLHSYSGKIEGDYSNAAFLDAFNYIGSNVEITNLNAKSLQGDRVYADCFNKIANGTPTLDISDCPDLAPVLFALAALKNGAVFTGTDRLKAKESDRGMAMHLELKKLGGGLVFGDNTITVPKQELKFTTDVIDSHNDHRIAMAMSVILSKLGGEISGVESTKKSYPGFFKDIIKLGAKVNLE